MSVQLKIEGVTRDTVKDFFRRSCNAYLKSKDFLMTNEADKDEDVNTLFAIATSIFEEESENISSIPLEHELKGYEVLEKMQH